MAIVALSVPVGTSGYCAAIGFGCDWLMQVPLFDCASDGLAESSSHDRAQGTNDVNNFLMISSLWCFSLASGKRMDNTKVTYKPHEERGG